jgi:putative transcriptional regulator
MSAIARLGLIVAAFVLQTAFLSAALPTRPDEAPAGSSEPSLAGQLLVATPDMGDPHFERTVILVVQHDPNGALGIVLNRPVGDKTLASLLDAVGEKGAGVAGSVRVFAGGPVQPEVGFVVHSAEYRRPETIAVNDRLSVTSSVGILRDIADKSGPAKILVAFGYAGWGPDQLEKEIEAGAWVTAEADAALVFDSDRDTLWDDAWKRRTEHL